MSGDVINQEGRESPRILYLTKVYPYPPACSGDAVYSKGIIEALSRVCQLTVLCAESGAQKRPDHGVDWHIAGKRREGVAGSVFSRWPLIAWKGATREFVTELSRLLEEEWDAIVLDNIGLAFVLPYLSGYCVAHAGTCLVYVSHECEYETRRAKYDSYELGLVKGIMANRDLAKVQKCEEALIRLSDVVTVINTADLKSFRKVSSDIKYLPLIPGYDGPIVDKREITNDTPRRVLLLGGRQSEQKRQILLDWMKVAYTRLVEANIEMVIVGDMEEGLRGYLKKTYPAAQVLGFVDDLEGLISSARMGLIADTVGGGFKLRLLSHVFGRLPIIGLDDAISGLATDQGAGYLGVNSLQSLTDLVCRVIDDIDGLNALQETAFNDCTSAYLWSTRATAFVNVLNAQTDELV